MIDPEQLIKDAQEQIKNSKLSLEEVVKLCEDLEELQEDIEALENLIAETKEDYRVLSEVKIPEALNMIGLKELVLKDGSKIGIEDVISASIKEDNKFDAHEWLKANGYGDLIKSEVALTFGKGEEEDAQKLVEAVEGMKINYGAIKKTEKVHPQTLKIKNNIGRGIFVNIYPALKMV